MGRGRKVTELNAAYRSDFGTGELDFRTGEFASLRADILFSRSAGKAGAAFSLVSIFAARPAAPSA